MEILHVAARKLRGNVSKHLLFAEEARIVIHAKLPHCLVTLTHSLMCFHLNNVMRLLKGGEWRLKRENVVPNSRDSDILQWWEGTYARLGQIAAIGVSHSRISQIAAEQKKELYHGNRKIQKRCRCPPSYYAACQSAPISKPPRFSRHHMMCVEHQERAQQTLS